MFDPSSSEPPNLTSIAQQPEFDFSPSQQLDLPETQLAAESQSQNHDSISNPDPAEVAKSWGYLRPFRPDKPCIYFYLDKPTYIIGRENGPIPKDKAGNEIQVEQNDVCLGERRWIREMKEVDVDEYDMFSGAFVKRKRMREVEVPVDEGKKITGRNHCTIAWDNVTNRTSVIIVTDHSTNGTYINSTHIKKNTSRLLRDGNEIAFGMANPIAMGRDDFRYIFHYCASPPVGGLMAKYDIGRELGKGTFASVFLALERNTNKYFAVKTIRRDRFRAHSKEIEEKFYREVRILKSLEHENVVKLVEMFEDGPEDEDMTGEKGSVHLVMEYVEGGDLLERIIMRGGLSVEEARHITHQICCALEYIHGNDIAHRDLKPENILLTATDPPIVKVADFGLAKAVHSMTMFRTMCGTPHYLAPEVVLRDHPEDGYTALVDSYSVGVIVFCMLANALPYQEDPEMSREERIRARSFDWEALRYRIGDNPVVRAFIGRLTTEDPSVRMTLTAALQHEWLRQLTIDAALKKSEYGSQPKQSQVPGNSKVDNQGPSQPVQVDERNGDAMLVDGDTFDEPATDGGTASVTMQMQSVSFAGNVPGAYPESSETLRGSNAGESEKSGGTFGDSEDTVRPFHGAGANGNDADNAKGGKNGKVKGKRGKSRRIYRRADESSQQKQESDSEESNVKHNAGEGDGSEEVDVNEVMSYELSQLKEEVFVPVEEVRRRGRARKGLGSDVGSGAKGKGKKRSADNGNIDVDDDDSMDAPIAIAVAEDSDSSLTPMSEDGNVVLNNTRGRGTRGRKRGKIAAGAGGKGGGGRRGRPRRVVANVDANDADMDSEDRMDVEPSLAPAPAQGRVTRQSARLGRL